ncbi:hypothetical protein Holit_00649 [Hollandina sp. SP2]
MNGMGRDEVFVEVKEWLKAKRKGLIIVYLREPWRKRLTNCSELSKDTDR